MLNGIDSVAIQFTPEGLRALNAAQALMMFIVSLYLDGHALREARRFPRAVAVGLLSQWLLLPLLTVVLIVSFEIPPSIALGLLLVSACPGGNASAFLTLLARGSLAVSVSTTAVSMLATAVLTPLVFAASGALAGLSQQGALRIDPWLVLETVLLLLVLPLCAGLLFRQWFPRAVQRIRGPLKAALGGLLLLAILGAAQTNGAVIQGYAWMVAPWILGQNAIALAGSYGLAWLARLPEADRRAITIGSGITSSGINLLLVFSFFGGAGAMAVVAVTWSVWRLITGGLLALIWSRLPPDGRLSAPSQSTAEGRV